MTKIISSLNNNRAINKKESHQDDSSVFSMIQEFSETNLTGTHKIASN